MIKQTIRIRNAEPKDADTLFLMGIQEEGFAVSSKTRFYGKDYLRDWIENSGEDILLVAEVENEIVGFLFCRLNRSAWAMLENIAVLPSERKQGVATLLLKECLRQLHSKGIDYIAGMVRDENNSLGFFLKSGFSCGNKFIWIERQVG